MGQSENRELELAQAFVDGTGCHIFLTGKAGTGKTTFLKQLKQGSTKRMIVTAPTGVAAINAGGVTLHSFFQLPFGPFVPGMAPQASPGRRMFRFSREKRQIITSLDLLVIDEISMVRADLLDSVDEVLKRIRRRDEPFGGVQLLMIGDLHQLPPVVKSDDRQLLGPYYETLFFFGSHALCQTELVTIELQRVYRQSDSRFIELLNKVRDSQLDDRALEILNGQYRKDYDPATDPGCITLTTHNNRAETINRAMLGSLPGNEHGFDARVTGEFPDHTRPAPESLVLKKGAQVMFLRNDPSPEKLFYNGKIGHITGLTRDEVYIACPDQDRDICLTPVEWENIQYQVNPENQEIQEKVIGKFKQIPLKPAWAITIHKSQGLTFDRAVIDARSAFAHGQVYVALSRLKSLEGMTLSTPLPMEGMKTDSAILDFMERAREEAPDPLRLEQAQKDYQQKLILECFDLELLSIRLNALARILMGNARLVSGTPDPAVLRKAADHQLFSVSEKFKHQLQDLFNSRDLPEKDPRIVDRTAKASAWFGSALFATLGTLFLDIHFDTDNKELEKKITRALDSFQQELKIRTAGIKACEKGFALFRYQGAVARARVDALPGQIKKKRKPSGPVFSRSDILYPELFEQLRAWRTRISREQGLAPYQVLHQQVLIQICMNLPETVAALNRIKGVGRKTVEKYGADLLSMVAEFRRKKGINGKVIPPEPTKEG